MSGPTGPMLALTAVSFGNQWLGNGTFQPKILVAGLVATGGLALAAQAPGLEPVATGIAWLAFLTLLFTRIGGKPSPVDNIKTLTGL